jgi:hypothetical protein
MTVYLPKDLAGGCRLGKEEFRSTSSFAQAISQAEASVDKV